MQLAKRPLLVLIFFSLILSVALAFQIVTNQHIQVAIFGKTLEPVLGTMLTQVERIDPEAYSFDPEDVTLLEDHVRVGKFGQWTYCQYVLPEVPEYAVDLLIADVPAAIAGGSIEIDMTFRNTGNTRLFAADSECYQFPSFSVGTQLPMDRLSAFGNTNRMTMQEPFADPGEAFHVVWSSSVPATHENDIYREFLQPVVDGVAWIDEIFAYDVHIGTPTEDMKDDIQFVTNLSLNAMALDGLERNLTVSLKEQKMIARFGEIAVWDMPISSGHYETPTPRGNYKVFEKMELRIGFKYPHYHMPWWQQWKSGGYGLHGLPYLAKDGGTFWKEAENHMGWPVSHGCIRTLDRDAETLYKFTTIGTPIVVK